MTDAAIDKMIAKLKESIDIIYEDARNKIAASCGPNMAPKQEVILECMWNAMQCAKIYQKSIVEIERSRCRPISFIIKNGPL